MAFKYLQKVKLNKKRYVFQKSMLDEMVGLSRYIRALLQTIHGLSENDEFCELDVQCMDGTISVHGIIFAAIYPALNRFLVNNVFSTSNHYFWYSVFHM